jgi:hypothetical protein
LCLKTLFIFKNLKFNGELKIVIIYEKAGQLANGLFLFGHFIANSIEYKYKLVNLSFNEYCSHFNSTLNGEFLNYPIKTKFFRNSMIVRNFIKINQVFLKVLSELNKKNNICEFFDISNTYDVKSISFDINDRDFVQMVKSIVILKNIRPKLEKCSNQYRNINIMLLN